MENYLLYKVRNLIHLATELSYTEGVSEGINNRIMIGNETYYTNIKLIKSKLLTRKLAKTEI